MDTLNPKSDEVEVVRVTAYGSRVFKYTLREILNIPSNRQWLEEINTIRKANQQFDNDYSNYKQPGKTYVSRAVARMIIKHILDSQCKVVFTTE